VVGLVYIAALAPDTDETSQSQQAKFRAAARAVASQRIA
jgi:hypothetical protein